MEENKNVLSDNDLEDVSGGVMMGVSIAAQTAVLRGKGSGGVATTELRTPVSKKKGKKGAPGIQTSITEHDGGFKVV